MTTSSTALITGASRGLGLALAKELARRHWALLIDARDEQSLQQASAELMGAAQIIALAGDVTDPAHRTALAAAAHSLGGLDAVVNNASDLGVSPLPSLLDYPLEALEQVYRTNTLAPLALLQAVRAELKPGGRILNITSDAGVEPYPGWGGYGSSKAALEQLSHVLAAEQPELRVYWVDPGDMRTRMHQQAYPGEDISDRPLPEESVPGLLELLTGDMPSGRYRAREVGHVASSEAGDMPLRAVKELRVAFTVDDFDRSIALFREGLQLRTIQDWTDGSTGRSIVLAAGAATIELLDRDEAAYTDAVEVGERAAGPVRLALEVADVARTAARLQAYGAKALHTPTHTSWGNFTQRLQAPDGLNISLYQPDATVAQEMTSATQPSTTNEGPAI